jgi:hypothetical protein
VSAMEVSGVPLFPPPDFVERFNAEPVAAGLPYRTAMDPLVMHAWHLATAPAPQSLLIVTGI